MSAIYGRVGRTKAQGFTDLFENEYEKKCKIDAYSHSEQDGSLYATFGECLQYITQESINEKLPIAGKDLLFTADLILDNRDYVIARLESSLDKDELAAEADGSLVFRLLEKEPKEAAKHLLGMFAYAVYNETERSLTLTADPVASRCLYYYYDNNQVVFSTILAPLIKWCPSIEFSEEYLKDYLGAPGLMPNILSDISPFKNIYMLNPGSRVEFLFTDSEVQRHEEFYLDWSTGRGITDGAIGSFTHRKSPDDYLKDFRKIYSDCVKSACRTKDNVAISLSSGFDSSSVGALAAITLQESHKNLYTFTYVPFEKPATDHNTNNIHDESKPVKEIGAMYPNMIQQFLNNDGKNCVEDLPDITNTLEIPIKAVANMPSLFEVFQKAREKNCRILLTGQTGNASVSCGYIDHVLFDLYLHHHYIRLIKYLFNFSKDVGESRKKALTGVLRMCRWEKMMLRKSAQSPAYYPAGEGGLYSWINADCLMDWDLTERFKKAGSSFSRVNLRDANAAKDFLTSRACHSYLGVYETKAGLKNGVILRDPTRDPRIIWFCYNLPYHLFAFNGRTRWLIREGLKDLLPSSITTNQIRYGVQNSDCGRRLLRDKNAVNRLLKENADRAGACVDSHIMDLIIPDRLPKLSDSENGDLPQSTEVELLTAFGFLSFINWGHKTI